MARSLVKNAGSERQVRRAARTEAERDERFRDGLLGVMSSARGRAFVWGLLEEAGVYRSVWADHGQLMARNVGKQDYGHWLLAELLDVDENLYQLMEREGRAFKRREDKETDAAQTAGDDNEGASNVSE